MVKPTAAPKTKPRVGLLTDSSSQIPDDIRRRYDVEVVPIIVTIDGRPFREGIDIDADEFYRRLTDPPPDITTSQPSPGEFLEAYRALEARGADEIVAVLVGAEYSGAVNAAGLAADLVETPIHIVDTRTASFGVTACLWELAEHLELGCSVHDSITLAEKLVPHITMSVLLDGLDYARRSGRTELPVTGPDRSFVFSGVGADLTVVGSGSAVDELSDLLLRPFTEATDPIRTAVCLADPATTVFADRLEHELRRLDQVVDVARYRVGPSIAAHTGPGTAGGFFWPAGI